MTVLGQEMAPTLTYRSNRAVPNQVIDIPLTLNPDQSVEFTSHSISFELYIEGNKTDNFTFDADLQAGEVGRFRYLWDGRDGQGQLLPPGIYEYVVKLGIPYRAQYCYALNGIFGNPPDCINGATGVYRTEMDETWLQGTIQLDPQPDSPYGSGWVVSGQQRLYQDSSGRIMIADGTRMDEFWTFQTFGGADVAHLQTQLGQELLRAQATVLQPAAPAKEEALLSDTDASTTYTENKTAVSTEVCGTLSTDTRWSPENSPYVLRCRVNIPSGILLTIEPGVIIKGTVGPYQHDLYIAGGLIADGTADRPIVFTSLRDDSYGGDTNGDGNATTPATGDWGGIIVPAGSMFRGISHTVLAYTGYHGITVDISSPSMSLTFEQNHFHHNHDAPIFLDMMNVGGQLIMRGNIVRDNDINGVAIRGSVTGALSLDWRSQQDFPLVLHYGDLTVERTGILNLSPNTIIKAGIPLAYRYGLPIAGQLIANGTLEQPVIFTSFQDDNYGGDTNNNGNSTVPASGDWGGIRFAAGSQNNHLSQCIVAYGGATNITTETDGLSVLGCSIRHGYEDGIRVEGNVTPSPITGNQFISNRRYGLRNTGVRTINAAYNWWGDASGPQHPSLNPTGKGNPVSDNVVFDPWLPDATGRAFALSLTATDYTTIEYDSISGAYTRIYPSGHLVHFNSNGTHDYTQDPNGHRLGYGYNPDGSIASMSFTYAGEAASRHKWSFAYSGGRLTGVTDPAGKATQFSLNALKQLTDVIFPDGTGRRFLYDNRGLLVQRWDEDGNSWRYGYDRYGRVNRHQSPPRAVYNPQTGAIEVQEEERRFTNSETGYALINDSPVGSPDNPAPAMPKSAALVAKVQLGRGSFSGHMNQWGAWSDLKDAIGRPISFARDAHNRITRRTEPDGSCVDFTYDTRGNRLSSHRMDATSCAQIPAAHGAAAQSWLYSYEPRFNRLKTVTDPLGQITTYIYDYEEGVSNAGRLIRIQYPAITIDGGGTHVPTVRYGYTALGLLETVTDEAGIVTRYRYDASGRLMQMIENEGGLALTTVFQDFDAAGRPQTVIRPRNNRYQYSYDSWGRVLTETDPLGVVTRYGYDGRGNVIRTTVDATADGSTGRNVVSDYAYDADNRLLSQRTDADSFTLADSYAYDINGNLALHTDSEGQSTRFTYDNANQLTGLSNALGETTGFTYTAKSELAHIRQANGEAIAFAHDAFGNLENLTPADQPAHQFAYTLRDEVAAYTPPDVEGGNSRTSYSYNNLGQMTGVARPDGKTITYAYDSALRLRRVTQPRGDTVYHYHPVTSQLVTVNAPGGINLSYGYDHERLASVSWSGPLNGTVNYGYDEHYRLTSLAVNGANAIGYQYDSNSFLIKAGDLTINRLPQSRAIDTTILGQVTDDYEYDGFGKLIRYFARAGNRTLYDVRYSYDDLDRIATQIETIGGATTHYVYRYDAVGRLVEVKANGASIASYGYDGNGNRISGPGGAVGRYDAQDRMMQYGSASYSYTANGELLTKTANGQTTSYNYDVFSNLMSVTLPGGKQIDYLIDSQDRRIGKKVNGALVQGWLYGDQLEPVAEVDGNGNIVSRFVYGSSEHVPDYMIKGGVTYRIISDHLGSVHLVVNTQTGEIAQQMNYDAFGRVTQDTRPGFQPFGFAGGLYDTDTGLVRFGARDYDAETGRWTTKDPIGFEHSSTNLYLYTNNDSINLIDKNGLESTPVQCSCIAIGNSGGIGYSDGVKWCRYSCTSTDGRKRIIDAPGKSTSGGDVCYGARMREIPNMLNDGPMMTTVTDGFEEFDVDTDSWFGGQSTEFEDIIERAFSGDEPNFVPEDSPHAQPN